MSDSDSESHPESPLVLQGRQRAMWLEFLDDCDPVLAAMALEAKNTPPKISANQRYYCRKSEALIEKAKQHNKRYDDEPRLPWQRQHQLRNEIG
ncbi:uncharacterized protein ARMOST_15512 [Armillaria ostoyae]|uniref:Uncharacterized protein n=1 Tax=Armillaria ostoyae TaxID=47428 RepID=A0A284RTH5_ARMOS|nr:uncharacterized protein ARMOST_15512 [Armillaria ostoyae]